MNKTKNIQELPFLQQILGNKKIRTFSENVDSDELKWHFDDEDRVVKVLESDNWLLQMDNQLPVILKEGNEYFIPKGVYHRTIKGSGQLKVEITESNLRPRNVIRTVVKDLINVIKKNKEGEYTLPDESSYEIYSFEKFPVEFSVEITVKHDNNLNGFKANAEYSSDDDVIELVLIYNPKTLDKNLYGIVGELNELVAHEIEHMMQTYRGEFSRKKKTKSALEYYTQSHEIPAQVKGFKRLSKLQKKPFEEVVRNWFETHQEIHTLDKNEQNIVIDKLLNYGKNI